MSSLTDAEHSAVLARLARVEGQVRGVRAMVDDQRLPVEVITQIGAIQGALDMVALEILEDAVRRYGAEISEQAAAELLAAVRRLVRSRR